MSDEIYYFIFNGKFQQADSILDLKNSCEPKQWETVVHQTAAVYAQFTAMKQELDDKDKETLKHLQSTIDILKGMNDPKFIEADVDALIHNYKEIIKSESDRLDGFDGDEQWTTRVTEL